MSKKNISVVSNVLMKHFVNRRDTYAVQKSDGSYIRKKEHLTRNIILQHLQGKKTIGIYQLKPKDDTVKWICFDIDPKEVAKAIYYFCIKNFFDRAVWLEASRYSDQSYHIWILFLNPVPAEMAKWLGIQCLSNLGISNVEVFPKQASVRGRFGNIVKLPLGLHRKNLKWSRWLNPEIFLPFPNESILKAFPTMLTEEQTTEIWRKILKKKQRKPLTYTSKTDDIKKDYNIFSFPCVQAFRDHSIPAGRRHEVAAKNFSILYHRTIGGFKGFEGFAEELVRNQMDFTSNELVSWIPWVKGKKRRFNCSRLKKFLGEVILNYSCVGCSSKREKRRLRAFRRRVDAL